MLEEGRVSLVLDAAKVLAQVLRGADRRGCIGLRLGEHLLGVRGDK